MSYPAELLAHLASGATTLCRAWAVDRRDGVSMGFTDHDRDLGFEGRNFHAETALSAATLQQTTGLSVDNSEASGALSAEGIGEGDILAGRYDGARIRCWLVNWQDVEERALLFSGTIGEITRGAGAFRAELRGLAERLNLPVGRVYQSPCSAILGDGKCRVDLTRPEFSALLTVEQAVGGREFLLSGVADHAAGWFERGRFAPQSGEAQGLLGLIKVDRREGSRRRVELWQPIDAAIAGGDTVRLEAGCDRRAATCRAKFANLLNFRGFPSIPGEDWLIASPSRRVQG